jgi:hypothetical protein
MMNDIKLILLFVFLWLFLFFGLLVYQIKGIKAFLNLLIFNFEGFGRNEVICKLVLSLALTLFIFIPFFL